VVGRLVRKVRPVCFVGLVLDRRDLAGLVLPRCGLVGLVLERCDCDANVLSRLSVKLSVALDLAPVIKLATSELSPRRLLKKFP
jgi:hypothetical protein